MNNFRFFRKTIVLFISYLFLFFLVRMFSEEYIIFYQGIFLLLASLVMFISYDYFICKKLNIILTNLPIYFSYALLSYSFLMTFPVVLDRSITLHMYSYLYKNPGANINQIQDDFVGGFVYDSKAIEKRIEEQIFLKNISSNGDSFYLTDKGNNSHLFFMYMSDFFNINTTYSDNE